MQFNRPVEYDPNLIVEVESQKTYTIMDKEAAMMNEFGLDDGSEQGSEEDSDSDEDNEKRSWKKTTPTQMEFDKLTTSLTQANQMKLKTERRYERAQEKQLQVQRQSKQAKHLLMERHSKQIDALKDQLEEHKKIVQNDQNRTRKLQELYIFAKQGGKLELSSDMFFHLPLADVKKENTKLRSSLEQLNLGLRQVKNEFSEVEKERDKYSRMVPADFVHETGDRQKSRLASVREAIETSKGEIVKKDEEEKELRFKLRELEDARSSRQAAENDPKASPVEQEKKRIKELLEKTKQALLTADAKEKEVISQKAQLKKACEEKKKKIEMKRKEQKESVASIAKNKKKKAELMKAAVNSKDETVANLKSEKIKLDEQAKEILDVMKAKEGELAALKDKAKDKLNTASDNIKKLKEEYAVLKSTYDKQKGETDKIHKLNKSLKDDIQKIETAGTRRKVEADKMLAVCAATTKQMTQLKQDIGSLATLVPQVQPSLLREVKKFEDKQGGDNKTLKENYMKELHLRRKYAYQYQQLRGSVRVYIRVRDIPGGSDEDNVVRVPSDEQVIVKRQDADPTCYEFDNKVIGMSATPERVVETVSDLMDSIMDGFHVTILCYGPTNTGKTHTLHGTNDCPGLYLNCVKTLFRLASETKDTKFQYNIHVLAFDGDGAKDVVNGNEVKTDGPQILLDRCDVKTETAACDVVSKGVKSVGDGNHRVGTARAVRIEVDVHNSTLDRTTNAILYIVDVGSEKSDLSDNIRSVIEAKARRSKEWKSLCQGSLLMGAAVAHMDKNSKLAIMAHVNPTYTVSSLETLDFAADLLSQPEEDKKKAKKK